MSSPQPQQVQLSVTIWDVEHHDVIEAPGQLPTVASSVPDWAQDVLMDLYVKRFDEGECGCGSLIGWFLWEDDETRSGGIELREFSLIRSHEIGTEDPTVDAICDGCRAVLTSSWSERTQPRRQEVPA